VAATAHQLRGIEHEAGRRGQHAAQQGLGLFQTAMAELRLHVLGHLAAPARPAIPDGIAGAELDADFALPEAQAATWALLAEQDLAAHRELIGVEAQDADSTRL
jgi:hypothetical protein